MAGEELDNPDHDPPEYSCEVLYTFRGDFLVRASSLHNLRYTQYTGERQGNPYRRPRSSISMVLVVLEETVVAPTTRITMRDKNLF